MATKIKRSEIQTFLNITPESPPILGSSSATYALLGDGVTSGKINYNPKTAAETYITEDSATTTLESYAPVMPVEQTAKSGDDVFDYVDALRIARAVLTDAESDIVNVWIYEGGGPNAYPAEQQMVSIQIEDFGGEGGVAAKINYSINFIGDAIKGTMDLTDPDAGVFTPLGS